MLEFNIRNQEISRIDNFSPAEKSVEYLIAKFNFKTEDWNGAIKRAIFRNVKSKVEKDAMLEDDSCVVPWEVLVGSGDIEVSVHGVIGTEEITTDVAVFNLNRTLQGGSATQEPSPTVYEQMVEMVKGVKEVAQSVRTDADNGKFNGQQGDSGKDGKSAYQYAVEGGYTKTEEEFKESLARAGDVITKEEHEAELLKAFVKVTTDKAPYHHITDSANYRVLDFGMEGITEQETTRGVNLYPGEDIEFTGESYDLYINLPAGTYTLSAIVNSTDTDASVCLTNMGVIARGKTTRTSVTKTFTSDVTRIILFSSNSEALGAGDTATFKDIQIEPGEVATEYEPYTNGPSPNPTHPQEIKLAGVLNEETGRYEIGCRFMPKNLFDVSKVYSAYLVDNSIVFNNLTGATYLPTLKTLAPALKVGDIIYVYADITNGRNYFNIQGTNYNFGSPVEITDLKSQLIFYANGGITRYSNVIFSLTPDSTYDEFKQSQLFTLTSDRPLTMWDKLVKRDGVWGHSIWSKLYENVTESDVGVSTYQNAYRAYIYAITSDKMQNVYVI